MDLQMKLGCSVRAHLRYHLSVAQSEGLPSLSPHGYVNLNWCSSLRTPSLTLSFTPPPLQVLAYYGYVNLNWCSSLRTPSLTLSFTPPSLQVLAYYGYFNLNWCSLRTPSLTLSFTPPSLQVLAYYGYFNLNWCSLRTPSLTLSFTPPAPLCRSWPITATSTSTGAACAAPSGQSISERQMGALPGYMSCLVKV